MTNLDLFEEELSQLINKWSLENGCDMPDHAIAAYLRKSYENLCAASEAKVNWGYDQDAGWSNSIPTYYMDHTAIDINSQVARK